MFHINIDSSKLGERLDAGFYHPEYLALDEKLDNLGAKTLDSLVDGVSCGPFGGNAIADDLYAENGVSFIRPLNITSNIFDDTSLVKVPKSLLLDNGLRVYNGSNLYFGRVGVPCVALIEGETSISPNIIIAKLNDGETDSGFLHAFCSSRFGLSQLKRQLKEVAQPTTSTDSVRFLKIYCPNSIAQKYIGEKVRQSEYLRAWAKRLSSSSVNLVDALVHDKITESEVSSAQELLISGDHSLDKVVLNKLEKAQSSLSDIKNSIQTSFNTRVSLENLLPRLNSEFYEPKLLAISNKLSDSGSKTLGSYIQGLHRDPYCYGFEQYDKASDNKVPYVKGEDLTSLAVSNSNSYVDRTLLGEYENVNLEQGDLIISVRGYVGHVSVFNNSVGLPSPNVMVIRLDKNKVNPYFASAYFNSHFGHLLVRRYVTGSVQETITTEDIKSIQFYSPTEAVQNYIGNKVKLSEELDKFVESLILASKLIIEMLIDGRITEAEIVLAQQALDVGDKSLDRALLERMTAEGIDGEGDPLFDDIDQLYDLLEQAKQALDVEDTMAEV
ncbi:restriction endonuclease subunit S [Vibrio campbellii]|uniref:restriction endonuclease subunit S n=1 Tax=Vibrio campbellii TaxID=680 RepID=UPI00168D548E|nr:restriction endonuclease subunit S [Vibrio campbellii]